MVFMFFPVVFILVEIESVFLLYTEYIVKLEEMALPLMCRRFSDTDKSAAVVYKLFDCGNNRLIYPVFSAALCSIRIADIQNDIKLSEKFLIFANIVKTDKGYIKRRAAQCFDNTEVGVILFVIDCVMYHMISQERIFPNNSELLLF